MSAKDNGSHSFFYVDKDGKKTDRGLHDDRPAHPHAYAELSIRRAIASGMSPEAARRAYGHRDDDDETPTG